MRVPFVTSPAQRSRLEFLEACHRSDLDETGRDADRAAIPPAPAIGSGDDPFPRDVPRPTADVRRMWETMARQESPRPRGNRHFGVTLAQSSTAWELLVKKRLSMEEVARQIGVPHEDLRDFWLRGLKRLALAVLGRRLPRGATRVPHFMDGIRSLRRQAGLR